MRILLTTTALVFLAACASEAPKSCGWDQTIYLGDTECAREGNGDGPSAPDAPSAAPEAAPEPVSAPVAAPEPSSPPVARSDPAAISSVPTEPEPEPVDPEPEPEPEKPQYSDWAQPGDEALFDTDEYTDDEIDMKKMELAARRAQAEADHQAEFGGDKAGGFNR